MGVLKNKIKQHIGFDKLWQQQKQLVESQKILTGKLLALEHSKKQHIHSFEEVEFSVFSQVGDDGILQWLTHHIPFPEQAKSFVEFGVENYTEATTRFLLVNNNWRGMVMDGSEENVAYIQNDMITWMYDLTPVCSFITAENINSLLESHGFAGEIGILHIDIDGNDYWVWKAVTTANPIMVIVEYNSAFGNERAITVPYRPDFVASEEHYSRIIFGASVPAFEHLAAEKGYQFLGCNANGNNAYFIRNDYAKYIVDKIDQKKYVKTRFRQNRGEDGQLTKKSDHEVIRTFKNIKVYNVITKSIEPLNA